MQNLQSFRTYENCGHNRIFKYSDGKRYKCAACKRQYSVKVGTIFEDSKIPLQKWFAAIYLITSHKKGISSLQLHRDLGVTQKTAWYMNHRVRHQDKQYVSGDSHTNTMEGFWSLLKRGVIGIYHSVSSKYLQKYLDEFSFRYNTKELSENERFNFMLATVSSQLSYKQLTENESKKETIWFNDISKINIGMELKQGDFGF
jgi:transposase-like protein